MELGWKKCLFRFTKYLVRMGTNFRATYHAGKNKILVETLNMIKDDKKHQIQSKAPES
jgi:hypothetical protein